MYITMKGDEQLFDPTPFGHICLNIFFGINTYVYILGGLVMGLHLALILPPKKKKTPAHSQQLFSQLHQMY